MLYQINEEKIPRTGLVKPDYHDKGIATVRKQYERLLFYEEPNGDGYLSARPMQVFDIDYYCSAA
jgi:hypothetical protein